MALRHGRNAAVYINGVDLSGELNTINPTSEQELADITVFGNKGYTSYAGLAKDSVTIEGLYTDTERAVFEGMIQISTGYDVMIPYTQTTGTPAHACNEVMLKSNNIKSVATDVNRVSISLNTVNYPFQNCVMLSSGAAIVTATGTSASVDMGSAPATTGGYGYLQVLDVGSSGTLLVYIDESSTNAFAGEETRLRTFTAASSSETQSPTIIGARYQYIRCAYTLTATTATFALAMHVDGW